MRRLAAASLLTAVLACHSSKPADPALMHDKIDEAAPNLIDDLSSASTSLDSAQGSTSFQSAAHSLSATLGTPDIGSFAFAGKGGHDLANFLRDHVFIQANYEGDGVYRLHGADFCDAADAQCIQRFDQSQLRVRAEAFDDHIVVTLLVGPQRFAPLALTLAKNRISLALDLAGARSALQFLAGVWGQQIDLPAVMQGVVSVSLVRNGPQDFTFAIAVEKAVDIEGSLPVNGGPYKLTVDARNPAFTVRANGIQKTLSATLDVGPIGAQVPWSAVSPGSLASGTATLDLRGATGTLDIVDGQTSVKLTGLGLGGGTSSLELDGASLLAVTLNPGSSGKFDLEIAAPNPPSLSVTPEFDLSIAFDQRKLQDAGDSVDPALLHDTYRFQLNGTNPSVRPVDATTTFPGGLKVLSGLIGISAESGQSVSVHPGKCLIGNDAVTSGENAVVGKFAEVDCP